MRRDDGFTLIELMIVVAIIGLLSVIAIPNYAKFTAKARQVEARDGLSNIFALEIAYHGEKNHFGSLSQIGFVAEGRGRYTFCTSADSCQSAAIDPVGVGAAEGSGNAVSGGGLPGNGDISGGPVLNPTPTPQGGGGCGDTGSGNADPAGFGGGGCGGGSAGNNMPGGGNYASDDASSGSGNGSGSGLSMPGFPHYSSTSFEADAYGRISAAPAPDAWLIDTSKQLVNIQIGY